MSEQNADQRLADLEKKVDLILGQLKRINDITVNANKIVDNNFVILDKKIEELKNILTALDSSTDQNFKEVKLELIKINSATGYTDLSDNLKLIQGGK
jgi:hypothetical protein